MGEIVLQLPMKSEEVCLKGLLSVSYTHLDVYKRQHVDHPERLGPVKPPQLRII